MLLHNILIYFFFSLHFVLHPPLSLSLSAISFSPLSHFLALFFSQNSLFLLKFFTQILLFFFSNFLSSQFFLCCMRASSFAVWVWWVIDVMVMLWVWQVINFESCRGCGFVPWCSWVLLWWVIGFMVSWVMLRVWCGGSSALWSCHGCGGSSVSGHAVGVGCRRFYFCGCGLIFLGNCGLCEVVVDRWWWWVA